MGYRITLYQNEKIKIKYEAGFYFLYYHKKRLPLMVENLTAEQAKQLALLIEPALDRLNYITYVNGLNDGKQLGIEKMQQDFKKLLGI